MKVEYGKNTEYGTGVNIKLTGDEAGQAIHAYLVAHGIHINGPCTVSLNGNRCKAASVYVDPSGFVIHDGKKFDGKGPRTKDWIILYRDFPTVNILDKPLTFKCKALNMDDAENECVKVKGEGNILIIWAYEGNSEEDAYDNWMSVGGGY